ncbi:hypothetical protein QZH41_009026, partial [Actinostola sp. cb2023]
KRKTGRPGKRKSYSHKPLHQRRNYWEEEETCFGGIKRGLNNEVLLSPGVFEELSENIKVLSQRCDLRVELEVL